VKRTLTILYLILGINGCAALKNVSTKGVQDVNVGYMESVTNYAETLAEELGIRHFEVILTYESEVYVGIHFTAEENGRIVKRRTEVLTRPARQFRIWFLYRTSPIDPRDSEEARHFFKVKLCSIEEGPRGAETKEQVFLQQLQRSEHIAGRSWMEKSFLFNRSKPLPVNKRLNYCKLLDKKGRDGQDILYSIDFEVSDKPIKGSRSSHINGGGSAVTTVGPYQGGAQAGSN